MGLYSSIIFLVYFIHALAIHQRVCAASSAECWRQIGSVKGERWSWENEWTPGGVKPGLCFADRLSNATPRWQMITKVYIRVLKKPLQARIKAYRVYSRQQCVCEETIIFTLEHVKGHVLLLWICEHHILFIFKVFLLDPRYLSTFFCKIHCVHWKPQIFTSR